MPLTSRPVAVESIETDSVAEPALEITFAVVVASYSRATPGANGANVAGPPSDTESVAGTEPPTVPSTCVAARNLKYARCCTPVFVVSTNSRHESPQAVVVCHGYVYTPSASTESGAPPRVTALTGNGRGVMSSCPGVTVFSVWQSTWRVYGLFFVAMSSPR